MARTTEAAVRAILSLPATTSVEAAIDTATDLVSELCVTRVSEQDLAAYSATRLELIERWLSAHFYAIMDRDYRVASEAASTMKQDFTDKTGLHLDQTVYGQHAMLLDTKGFLSGLNASVKEQGSVPGVWWIGKKPVDQKAWEPESDID